MESSSVGSYSNHPSISAEASAIAYTFDNYQEDAGTTAIYPDAGEGSPEAVNYAILGLIGEAGEIANKWKKFIRDGQSIPVTSDAYKARLFAYKLELQAELGDVLWYAANLATELGVSFGDVAADNYRKLLDRKTRDVIHGSGDER